MGVVYEAVREDIAARAALKLLRPEFAVNAEISARFFNEARAANLIAHPGIVRVFDYGHESGAAYLAMEFLEGESLWTRMERRRKLSAEEVIRLGRQVASALAAAHEKQIVHRDLKPDNIFIVTDAEAPGGERAKLLDFGIAKMADEFRGSVRTQVNVIMGTPAYMAPEQCRGSKGVGDRTDVYALGCILFEMLSGRTPFVAMEPGEFLAQHMLSVPPRLVSIVPQLRAEHQRLCELVDSMLRKEPQTRPAMQQVAQELSAGGLQAGESVLAKRVVAPRPQPTQSATVDELAVTDPRAIPVRVPAVAVASMVPAPAPAPAPVPPSLALTVHPARAAAETGGSPKGVLGADFSGVRADVVFGPAEVAPAARPAAPAAPSSASAKTEIKVAGKPEVALSGPVWQPMEIVKTSYVSVPGVQPDANTGKKRLQRVLGALPPALLWMLVYVTAGFLMTWLRGGFR